MSSLLLLALVRPSALIATEVIAAEHLSKVYKNVSVARAHNYPIT